MIGHNEMCLLGYDVINYCVMLLNVRRSLTLVNGCAKLKHIVSEMEARSDEEHAQANQDYRKDWYSIGVLLSPDL